MKLNEWSIHKTADKNGLALKPPPGEAHHYEVCVAVRHGQVVVNVYVDGLLAPVARMELPTKLTWRDKK